MSKTLDEMLADAGISREDWQRARKVVEDYWEPFARANGWEPKRAERQSAQVEGLRVTLPLFPERWAFLEIPGLLSETEFSRLIEVLGQMRHGLVRSSQDSQT